MVQVAGVEQQHSALEYECAVCHKGKRDRIMLYPVHAGSHRGETLCTQCVLDNGGNAILHDPNLR